MIIVLQLVPYSGAVTLNLFDKVADGVAPDTTPVNGAPISGVVVTNRPGRYTFDLGATPPGNYELHTTGVPGFWVLELSASSYRIADSWEDLDSVSVTLSPEYFLNQDEVTAENELILYNNEIRTITVNHPTGNFDGQDMTFVVENEYNVNLVEISGLTSITNSVVISVPSIAKQNCCCTWALRRTSTGLVIHSGPAIVKYAPIIPP